MHHLDVRFFGEASICYNGQNLYLPYSRAVEVMLVLLHEKHMGRFELCDLVWDLEQCEEDKAKKSLRHVIYTIRKYTSDNFIQSPKREIILIDEGTVIRSDLAFIQQYEPSANDQESARYFLECCNGAFFQSCKNAGAKLEQWIDLHAQIYHRLYVGKLRQLIDILLRNNDERLGEQSCLRLLSLEEYDEPCCVSLMKLYQKAGRLNDALKVYQDLEARLADDLSVKPLPETTEVYLHVKGSAIRQKRREVRQELYGRGEELGLLQLHSEHFTEGFPFQHCVISGEAGIGKTALIQTFLRSLNQKSGLILNLRCYELEESFMLRLWDQILDKMSEFVIEQGYELPKDLVRDLSRVFPTFRVRRTTGDGAAASSRDPRDIDKNICALFHTLCGQYRLRILIAIDDLQWIDDNSLSLLNKVLFTNRRSVMLVASHRGEQCDKLERFYYYLGQLGGAERIVLPRFSEEKTRQFISQAYPEILKQAQEIYSYTEGNPLFLIETINNIRDDIHVGSITDKMAMLIEGRILRLSEDARKLMSICSIFYDDVTVQTLTELVELNESALIDALGELVNKNILKETVAADGAIHLAFTHSIIQQYVYDSMSKTKKALMHSRIGKYLETQLRNIPSDRLIYPKLIHHYEKADNKVKLFEYKLKRMQATFNVCHELFPVLETGRNQGLFDEYGNERILRQEFTQLYEIYEEISFMDEKNTQELQVLFLYLYGRFCNGSGNLPVALEVLSRMMTIAERDEKYTNYRFRGAIQLIQYAINCNDLGMMRANIERALQVANQAGNIEQSALAYRHFGYYHVLKGQYEKGEIMLEQARKQFESLNDRQKYKLHIAATFFFSGESKCRQNQFQEALAFYEKTLGLCDTKANITSAAVLYLRFGYIYYRLGQFDLAMDFLKRSINAYARIIFIWGRPDAYFYLHKVCQQKNLTEESNQYLATANEIMSTHHFRLSV